MVFRAFSSLMSVDRCTALVLTLYGTYLYSGLVLLLLAAVPSLRNTAMSAWLLSNAYIRWDVSIYLLAAGNATHAGHLFGWAFAVKFFIVSTAAIVLMEEYGLATGNVFGNYAFSTEENGGLEGPRVRMGSNQNLPVLVLALWHALLYPCFLLSLNLCHRFGGRGDGEGGGGGRRSKWMVIFLASILLTFFDAFSEPISAIYGHRLWSHVALNNNNNNNNVDGTSCPLDSYLKQPDWEFNGSKWDLLSYEYLSIPIQNFFGWFVSSVATLTITFLFVDVPQHTENPKSSKLCNASAVLVNFATATFYLAHPCHFSLVKILASFYIIIFFPLFVFSKTK